MSRRAAPQPDSAATPSRTSSNHSMIQEPFLTRWMGIVALVLRILLWPLRRLLQLTFPASDCDGLSSAASAKATRKFVRMLQEQQSLNDTDIADDNTAHEHWQTTSFVAARQQAVDQSAVLLLVLHAPLLPDSTSFIKTTLPLLANFTAHPQVVALGVDIYTAQGCQLAQLLRASAFPLVAVLQPSSTQANNLAVLFRAEGESLMQMCKVDTTIASGAGGRQLPQQQQLQLLTYLHLALARHEALAAEETARRIEREEATALRQAQDHEYQETLRMDQERQEQAAAEQLQRNQEEERLRLQEQAAKDAISEARNLIGDEPTEGGCMVRFVLPSGTKLNRRFATDATFRVLKAYLLVYFHDNEMDMGSIGLSTSFPRKSYNDDGEQEMTLEEAGLSGQAVLMVQDLDA